MLAILTSYQSDTKGEILIGSGRYKIDVVSSEFGFQPQRILTYGEETLAEFTKLVGEKFKLTIKCVAKELVLMREEAIEGSDYIFGTIEVDKVHTFHTAELLTCITAGAYTVAARKLSENSYNHYQILDAKDAADEAFLHAGTTSAWGILIGDERGLFSMENSERALAKFTELMGTERFKLTIKDAAPKTARELVRASEYFTEDEGWGDLDKMSPVIIQNIIDFRKWTKSAAARAIAPNIPANGIPIVIHSAYRVGTGKSRHYSGEALDFHLEGFSDRNVKGAYVLAIKLVEAWIKETGWKGGIGLYPHWNGQGFHLDCGNDRKWAYFYKKNRKDQYDVEYEVAKAEAETLAVYRKTFPNDKLSW